MKRFVLPAVATVVLGLAPAAAAQVVVPSGGEATVNSGTSRTERVAGTGRTPGTGRTEGTGRTPGTPGTGRTAGTPRTGGSPRELPSTGSPAALIAMDGAALLGAGLVLVRTRRRLIA